MKHYVYKITNLIDGREYIGVRSHPNPLADNYMGSSKPLKQEIEKLGDTHFKKVILECFDSREEAESREAELVNIKYVQDPNTYNLRTGGRMGHPLQVLRTDVYADASNIIKRYLKGESAEHIARDYGVDASLIREKIIPDHVRRTQSEANKLTRTIYPSANMRTDLIDNSHTIIEKYQSGESIDSIARHNNCHRDVIKRILKSNNISLRSLSESQKLREDLKKPKRKDLWNSIDEIKSLYLAGKTFTAIGALFNTSDTQIRNMIKKIGL